MFGITERNTHKMHLREELPCRKDRKGALALIRPDGHESAQLGR